MYGFFYGAFILKASVLIHSDCMKERAISKVFRIYIPQKKLCHAGLERCEVKNQNVHFWLYCRFNRTFHRGISVILSTFKCEWRNVSSQTEPLYTSCEVLPCWNIIAALSLLHWKLTEEQGSISTSVWDVVQFNFICLCEVCLICKTADYTEIKQECCSTLSLCEWMLSKCFIFTFFKYIF